MNIARFGSRGYHLIGLLGATLCVAAFANCGGDEPNNSQDGSANHGDGGNVDDGSVSGFDGGAKASDGGNLNDASVSGMEVGTPQTDPEAAAGIELVRLYAGTYNVVASQGTHSRGTVTISADGLTFDFDAGKTFTLSGQNVYNRIPNFPNDPRVQIEIPGAPQQRLRIFVNPANTRAAIRFVYYSNALSETATVNVTVTP